MLYAGSGAPGGSADTYKTAVIDTIVAEVQSVPGEDRCVLLLGYKDQMEEMFQVRMRSSHNPSTLTDFCPECQSWALSAILDRECFPLP